MQNLPQKLFFSLLLDNERKTFGIQAKSFSVGLSKRNSLCSYDHCDEKKVFLKQF